MLSRYQGHHCLKTLVPDNSFSVSVCISMKLYHKVPRGYSCKCLGIRDRHKGRKKLGFSGFRIYEQDFLFLLKCITHTF